MKLVLVVLLAMFASPSLLAQQALDLSGRHVFFLHPSVDELKGSYLFLVTNATQEPQASRIRLMLPEETFDWMPQDGIQPDELRPGENGGLVLEKTFPPGETMLSLGFRAAAALGEATLTFKPEYAVGSLALLSRQGALNLGSSRDGWQFSENMEFSGRPYDTLTRGSIAAGEKVTVTIGKIPEGRGRLWVLGFVAGGLFLIGGALLAWRTRPDARSVADMESKV